MKTQENNKLIAEFMGYKISDRGEYLLSDSLPQFLGSDHREWCSNRVENDNLIWEIPKDCLEYHTSWNWLMPVVEKIQKLYEECMDYNNQMPGDYYYKVLDKGISTPREIIYKAVVEFINQYNNNSFKTSSELAENC